MCLGSTKRGDSSKPKKCNIYSCLPNETKGLSRLPEVETLTHVWADSQPWISYGSLLTVPRLKLKSKSGHLSIRTPQLWKDPPEERRIIFFLNSFYISLCSLLFFLLSSISVSNSILCDVIFLPSFIASVPLTFYSYRHFCSAVLFLTSPQPWLPCVWLDIEHLFRNIVFLSVLCFVCQTALYR